MYRNYRSYLADYDVNTKMTTNSKKRTNSSDESLEKGIKQRPVKARRNSQNESAVSLREQKPEKRNSKKERRRRKKNNFRGTKVQKVFAKNNSEVFFDPNYWKIVDIKEIQNIILYLLGRSGHCPPWIKIRGKHEIKNVVTLMVPGLDPGMFGMSAELAIKINRPIEISLLLERGLYGDQAKCAHEAFPALSQVFSHACVTQAPGENGRLHSSFFSLMSCYIPEDYKKYLLDKSEVNVINFTDMTDDLVQQRILKCLLTHEQMRDNFYPIPTCIAKDSKPLPPGWIEIHYPEYQFPYQKQYLDEKVDLKILAIDCEMCITADGPALTRVSIIDDKLKVVYDSYVKPDLPIINYLTEFSGITEEILRDVTVTIKDVQTQISELVDKHTILVGHSLECDLKALQFAHPFIIDTSILYSDPRNSYKPKLKNLAKMWLNRNIQSQGPRGHDSIEDAMTCMDLLKMKLNRGLEFDKTHESIFKRIYRTTSSTAAIVDREAKTNLYKDDAKKVVMCKTDDEVLNSLTEIVSNEQNILYNYVFGRFLDLKTLPDDVDGRINLVKKLDERIGMIYNKIPNKTLFIITSGGGDSKEWLILRDKKQDHFSDWTEQDENELQNAYLKAKVGFSFFRLK
ncbi:ribonuclease H70 [Gigaspora margarita]|uniref:Ribonuclease H70 n=1 Tax=Gigaspora margarita TaxID=4874 RepID=A0A8H4ANH4_GIGMA|nr:ribonuclease H70 [Gigaspora margarita]